MISDPAVAAIFVEQTIFELKLSGILHIVNVFQNRSSDGASWLLIDGIVTLVLALMIWRQWPSSSLWVVGVIVGVDVLMTGATRLMLSLGLKRRLAS